MNSTLQKLIDAEKKAEFLFQEIENRGLIMAGMSEKELNLAVYELAFELFGIKKYWHKRIVRAGANTLLPYQHNPANITLKEDDILFLDFGPVFEEWEADFGRTYVIGDDSRKKRLKEDVEKAWYEGKGFFEQNKENITGAELYNFTKAMAKKYGWTFGNIHAGHLIGEFPHEKVQGEEEVNYIHPNNHKTMRSKDKNGKERHWIYEIHLIDEGLEIGAFFEQLLT